MNDTFGVGYDYVDPDADRLKETEKRTLWARTQAMLVVPRVDASGDCIGMYDVYTKSGSWYVVDLAGGGRQLCDCPDAEHHAPANGCKHYRRVKLALDETALPAPGESATNYWPWFEEKVRFVTDAFPRALNGDDNLEWAVRKALRKAREEMKLSGDAPDAEAE